MSEFLKCLKPDCMRKVTRGVAYCCEPCQVADTPPDRYELEPYDPAAYWTFVHSEFCEQRAAERGECSPAEATALDQSRRPAQLEYMQSSINLNIEHLEYGEGGQR